MYLCGKIQLWDLKNRSFKYLLTVLLCGFSIGAFSKSDATNTDIPMRTNLIINAGISDNRQPALGFTVSRIGKFGYYANFMIGIDNLHLAYDYRAAEDGSIMDGEQAGVIPFYSGRRATNRFSGTTGAFFRMGIPLYTYVGAGYGYRTETRQLLNGQWVQAGNSLGHSGLVDVGLMGKLGNFTLQAGYTLFIGQEHRLYHEAKVGIGFLLEK